MLGLKETSIYQKKNLHLFYFHIPRNTKKEKKVLLVRVSHDGIKKENPVGAKNNTTLK